MIKILLTLAIFLSVSAYADADRSVSFDLNQSSIKWTGSKVSGEHQGLIKLKSAAGKVSSDGTVSGSFEIDMQSLSVEDIEDPKYNKKLKDHLKDGDFFNVSSFPVVKFVITKSEKIAGAKAGEPDMTISGDLTIKDLTHPISFPATVRVVGGKVNASGRATVNRIKYGIKYNSGSFFKDLGDKLIYDDFKVEISLFGSLT